MKRILITGGTGSLGWALCRRWYGQYKLTVIAREDHKLKTLVEEMPEIEYFTFDLGNRDKLTLLVRVCGDQDFCVHAAAQKIVDVSQYHPYAYHSTNIQGTINLLDAWLMTHSTCQNILAISSDKAVAPLNFYGATKKIMEGWVRSVDGSVLRYGNVVSSKGSFLHAWKEREVAGFPISVRVGHPSGETPTRFFLTMDDALDLVDEAISNIVENEKHGIFVPNDLPAFDVMEVAKATRNKIQTDQIWGYEKLYEVLLIPGEKWSPLETGKLGRVNVPWWPDDTYYHSFRSDKAFRMSGREVLENVGWWR